MIAHPLIWAILSLDLVLILLSGAASIRGISIISSWEAEKSTKKQLLLERSAEILSIQARFATVLFVFSSVLALFAIVSVLPDVVPGAMCGSGVVEAMGRFGPRMIWARAIALCGLMVWSNLDKLNREDPQGTRTTLSARWLLLSTAIVAVALFDTARAFLSVKVERPVSCCATVLDAARMSSTAQDAQHTIPWTIVFVCSTVAVLASCIWLYFATSGKRSGRPSKISLVAFAVFSLIFCYVGGKTLIHELSAYYFQVLAHECAYCLFSSRHFYVGYPLFGALILIVCEVIAAIVAFSYSVRRLRSASIRVGLFVLVFGSLAGLPALIWRLRFGVWLG